MNDPVMVQVTQTATDHVAAFRRDSSLGVLKHRDQALLTDLFEQVYLIASQRTAERCAEIAEGFETGVTDQADAVCLHIADAIRQSVQTGGE